MFFSNNGITIICDDIHHDPASRDSIDNPRVVNGSQTLHSVYDTDARSKLARVMVRLIKIRRADASDLPTQMEKKKKIIREISIRSNFQNDVKKWNLVANDDYQHDLARYFRSKKLFYERRQNEWKDRRMYLKESGISLGPRGQSVHNSLPATAGGRATWASGG